MWKNMRSPIREQNERGFDQLEVVAEERKGNLFSEKEKAFPGKTFLFIRRFLFSFLFIHPPML